MGLDDHIKDWKQFSDECLENLLYLLKNNSNIYSLSEASSSYIKSVNTLRTFEMWKDGTQCIHQELSLINPSIVLENDSYKKCLTCIESGICNDYVSSNSLSNAFRYELKENELSRRRE